MPRVRARAQIQGQTPLHFCIAYNYDKIGEYLISKGAKDSIQNYFGYGPYDGLRPENREEALKLLREHLGAGVSEAVLADTLDGSPR